MLKLSLFGKGWRWNLNTTSARNLWTYYLANSRAWLVQSLVINCTSCHHGVKFWQLVASGNNIRCCWHCVVKASLPLHSDPIVWFSSHRQSTTESGPSMSVKTHHQSMCYWLSNCFLGWWNLCQCFHSVCMLQTTPIWLHLWCQACPLCQASCGRSVVFPVPGWGALMGNGRDVNCPAK